MHLLEKENSIYQLSSNMKMDDELIDDVFEDDPKHYYQNTDTGLNLNEATFLDEQTPSPTSKHPAFRNVDLKSTSGINEFDDGWKSFKIEDDNEFDESLLHKVDLVKIFINPVSTQL